MAKAKRLPYLPLFVDDFLGDPNVEQLRWIDQAIYLRMLMASWKAGPLPDDEELIVRMIGARGIAQEVRDLRGRPFDVHGPVRSILKMVWTKTDAGWISPRLEQERQHALELKAGRSDRAHRAAEARWSNAPSMPRACPEHAAAMPSQDQDQIQTQKEKRGERERERESEGEGEGAKPAPADAGPPSASSNGRSRPPRSAKPAWRGEIPIGLAGERFAACWARWIRFRREELRKPVTQISGDQALQELAGMGLERACLAIDHTIARGWQGIREPELPRNGHPTTSLDSDVDRTLRKLGFKA